MSIRKIGNFKERTMNDAVDDVLIKRISIRKAAINRGVKFQTLARLVFFLTDNAYRVYNFALKSHQDILPKDC